MARKPKLSALDEQISNAYNRENAAIASGSRAAESAARHERRAFKKAKQKLVAKVKEEVGRLPKAQQVAARELIDKIMPDTPDPVRPPKPKRPTTKVKPNQKPSQNAPKGGKKKT